MQLASKYSLPFPILNVPSSTDSSQIYGFSAPPPTPGSPETLCFDIYVPLGVQLAHSEAPDFTYGKSAQGSLCNKNLGFNGVARFSFERPIDVGQRVTVELHGDFGENHHGVSWSRRFGKLGSEAGGTPLAMPAGDDLNCQAVA